MTYTHLRPREFYEEIYDRTTVMSGREDQKIFDKMYEEFFRIMPDEKHDSYRSIFHLNLLYFVIVGDSLLQRYDNRTEAIDKKMSDDEAKDNLIASARLSAEPKCQHCEKTGLHLKEKMLHHRASFDEPEEVLFMLNCPNCKKNTACWKDGSILKPREVLCPKCRAIMYKKDSRNDKIITTTYKCNSCKHTYKDKIDLDIKKAKPDPKFKLDKAMYCLTDEELRKELRDAKYRYSEMARLGKDMKEREANKHIYDALKELKKPKIAELTPLLGAALEKAEYIEFSLDKPEMGREVCIGFSCLDSKSDREDYDSRKTLKKLIDKTLKDTNWRLMSDGISYRLGYLNGRLRAYEKEEDLKKLVTKTKKATTL